jgi:hypothetical protein
LSSTQAKRDEEIDQQAIQRYPTRKMLLTILEGALAELSGFLLELFNGTLIDTTALVNQVPSGSGLARIDVTDDYMNRISEESSEMAAGAAHRHR